MADPIKVRWCNEVGFDPTQIKTRSMSPFPGNIRSSRRVFPRVPRAAAILATGLVFLFCVANRAIAQAPSEEKPVMAEKYFKNVQVLKGIPVDQFLDTMGFFAASTGMNCITCHGEDAASSWTKYAEDTPLKQRARMMIVMMNTLNKGFFGGQRRITCWTCHRGNQHPKLLPELSIQYSENPDIEPFEIIAQTSGVPTIDEILDKYIQAIGGPQRVAGLTSIVGKGTDSGFDTDFDKVPVDVFFKAPDQHAVIVHSAYGVDTTTFDGHRGWRASPTKPKPLIVLTRGGLDNAKLDAAMAFPAHIKDLLVDWRVGIEEDIDTQHHVNVVQGRLTQGGLPVKLYFDTTSGLLVRMMYFADTPVGVVPTMVDYSDYRDVSGVKLPFQWVVTWTDGRDTFAMTDVRTNVPIDASHFAKPAPAVSTH
jgi:photosynthetic reaction center cytochrome c subunit